MTTFTTQQVNALAVTAAQGAIVMALAAGMSEFVSAGMAASAGMGSTRSASAQAEYDEINERIFKLSFVLRNYRDSVVSGREHRQELMMEYGITVTPSIVEMRRNFPHLWATERNLKAADEQLKRLELKDMLLKKRRKELARVLGIRVDVSEDIPKHVRYTQMKKFQAKTGMY